MDDNGIETVRDMLSEYEEQGQKLSTREVLDRLLVDMMDMPLLNESFESSQQSGEETVRDDATGGPPLTQNILIIPDSLQSKTPVTHDDIYNTENIVLCDQKRLHDNDCLRHQVRKLEEEVERLNVERQNQESQKKKQVEKLLHENDGLRHQVRKLEEEVERHNVERQNQESQTERKVKKLLSDNEDLRLDVWELEEEIERLNVQLLKQ